MTLAFFFKSFESSLSKICKFTIKVAQPVQVLSTTCDNLSSVLKAHTVEGKNPFVLVVF